MQTRKRTTNLLCLLSYSRLSRCSTSRLTSAKICWGLFKQKHFLWDTFVLFFYAKLIKMQMISPICGPGGWGIKSTVKQRGVPAHYRCTCDSETGPTLTLLHSKGGCKYTFSMSGVDVMKLSNCAPLESFPKSTKWFCECKKNQNMQHTYNKKWSTLLTKHLLSLHSDFDSFK